MSNLTNNTTELQAVLEILQDKVTGVTLPELSNEGTAADLLEGKEFIDSFGNKIVGTLSLDAEMAAQAELIEQLRTALENKSAGGGGDNAYKEQLDLMINRDIVSAVIPEGITTIGNYAYCDCRNLVNVSIPETVTTIGYRSFYADIALESITLPASLTTMNAGQTFTNCTKLTTVRLLRPTAPSIATSTFPKTVTKFIVPKGSKIAYTSASNWAQLGGSIVEEE